jgi:hypothetical protein
MKVAWCADSLGVGSPIITSSDGTKDGLVWAFGAEGTNQLHAWDLATGAVVFGGGGAAGTVPLKAGNLVHRFGTIAAVKGRIFVQGDGGLYAFKGP